MKLLKTVVLTSVLAFSTTVLAEEANNDVTPVAENEAVITTPVVDEATTNTVTPAPAPADQVEPVDWEGLRDTGLEYLGVAKDVTVTVITTIDENTVGRVLASNEWGAPFVAYSFWITSGILAFLVLVFFSLRSRGKRKRAEAAEAERREMEATSEWPVGTEFIDDDINFINEEDGWKTGEGEPTTMDHIRAVVQKGSDPRDRYGNVCTGLTVLLPAGTDGEKVNFTVEDGGYLYGTYMGWNNKLHITLAKAFTQALAHKEEATAEEAVGTITGAEAAEDAYSAMNGTPAVALSSDIDK